MKKITVLLSFVFFWGPLSIFAQKEGKMTVEVSSDTVGLDGSLAVTFTIENVENPKFDPPLFDGFEAQGPATSSSMSVINGAVSQKISYTFYLTPKEKGTAKIGSAKAGDLKTEEKNIVVVEHFEAPKKARQRQGFFDDDDSFFGRPMPQQKPEKKKKYEIERI